MYRNTLRCVDHDYFTNRVTFRSNVIGEIGVLFANAFHIIVEVTRHIDSLRDAFFRLASSVICVSGFWSRPTFT